MLSFGGKGDIKESEHEDDEHDSKEGKDYDEDEDGDAEEHVDVVDAGVDQAVFLLLVLGLPIAVDDSIAEEFMFNAFLTSRTLSVILITLITLLLEWGHS